MKFKFNLVHFLKNVSYHRQFLVTYNIYVIKIYNYHLKDFYMRRIYNGMQRKRVILCNVIFSVIMSNFAAGIFICSNWISSRKRYADLQRTPCMKYVYSVGVHHAIDVLIVNANVETSVEKYSLLDI
jgi:hypothetical protein